MYPYVLFLVMWISFLAQICLGEKLIFSKVVREYHASFMSEISEAYVMDVQEEEIRHKPYSTWRIVEGNITCQIRS